MRSILAFLFGDRHKSLEEVYLSNAQSLEDLERRQKNILRGTAPYQIY